MVSISKNADAISKIFNHPKIFKWISDDMSSFPMFIDEMLMYLMNEDETGVVRIDPMNGICCQVHIAMLPEAWGSGEQFVKEVIYWAIENTRYMKTIAMIPEYNRKTISLVKRCGFSQEGVIKKSFLKNMKLHDQILFGLTKTEFLEGEIRCQQQQGQE